MIKWQPFLRSLHHGSKEGQLVEGAEFKAVLSVQDLLIPLYFLSSSTATLITLSSAWKDELCLSAWMVILLLIW